MTNIADLMTLCPFRVDSERRLRRAPRPKLARSGDQRTCPEGPAPRVNTGELLLLSGRQLACFPPGVLCQGHAVANGRLPFGSCSACKVKPGYRLNIVLHGRVSLNHQKPQCYNSNAVKIVLVAPWHRSVMSSQNSPLCFLIKGSCHVIVPLCVIRCTANRYTPSRILHVLYEFRFTLQISNGNSDKIVAQPKSCWHKIGRNVS